MRFSRNFFAKFILASIGAINLLFAACSDSNTGNSNVGNQNVANAKTSSRINDDIGALSILVKLPETAADEENEVVWREDETANPNGKKLTAILKYNHATAAKIVASAEKYKPAADAEIGVEDWFPEELIAQSQLSGSESLKGTVYGANDFYSELYAGGRLVRIRDTNYFLLELNSR